MPRLLVFDVNETLLDLAALDAPFEQVFGDASVRRAWFAEVLRSAFVSVITDRYAGAFIARPGMVLGPLDEQPEIVGPDLSVVVDRILDIETA